MKVDPNSINLEKSAQSIQILAVIDTNYIKRSYPNPSLSAQSPTPIASNALFMLNGHTPGVSSSEGTGNLSLTLNVGDKVSLMGTSLSDNSGDAAQIYHVQQYSGAQVFGPFTAVTIEQAGAASAAETPDIIATSAQSQVFQAFESVARSSGSERLATSFALYTRSQNKKTLFGYFFWVWQASAA
ncbi:AidA/PixA family protein [Burkholderia aenigmatica]|uniref:AidA/PixA family protein n=1 Tax=Burkholderia aenigmatica TaxID=2015348 RepID=UPI002656EA49|nr:AidA/PixA family protein [Burkholderia aenigmatica]MDN7874045.1 AidA/PixA family protein [Burkholderia aenigmatica]